MWKLLCLCNGTQNTCKHSEAFSGFFWEKNLLMATVIFCLSPWLSKAMPVFAKSEFWAALIKYFVVAAHVLQEELFRGCEEGTCHVKLRVPRIAWVFLPNLTVMNFFHDSMVEQTCSPLLYHLDSIRSIKAPFSASLCNICITMPGVLSVLQTNMLQHWTCSNQGNWVMQLGAGIPRCRDTACYNYMPPFSDCSFLSCSRLHAEGEHLEQLRIGRCLNNTNQNTKQWRIIVKSIQKSGFRQNQMERHRAF